MKLIEIADVIRSANAGPHDLTFDVIFKTRGLYDRVRAKNAINGENFAALYGIPPGKAVRVAYFDPACAVKITVERPIASGAFGDSDIGGAQQHAPLTGMETGI